MYPSVDIFIAMATGQAARVVAGISATTNTKLRDIDKRSL